MKLIPNPCKSICKLKNDVCIGCYRTKEEIASWPKLSNDQRHAIVMRIKEIIKNT